MLDTERLLELLEEAVHGADCGCSTTARAYLTLAKIEWYRLIDDLSGLECEKMRAAAVFIDSLVSRQKSPARAARLAFDFWTGFDDGFNERTYPGRAGAAYRRGYRYGRDGS